MSQPFWKPHYRGPESHGGGAPGPFRLRNTHPIDFTAPNSQVYVFTFLGSLLLQRKGRFAGFEIHSDGGSGNIAKMEFWRLPTSDLDYLDGSTQGERTNLDPDDRAAAGGGWIFYNGTTFTTVGADARKIAVFYWDQKEPLRYFPDPRFYWSERQGGNSAAYTFNLALLCKDNALFGSQIGGYCITMDSR